MAGRRHPSLGVQIKAFHDKQHWDKTRESLPNQEATTSIFYTLKQAVRKINIPIGKIVIAYTSGTGSYLSIVQGQVNSSFRWSCLTSLPRTQVAMRRRGTSWTAGDLKPVLDLSGAALLSSCKQTSGCISQGDGNSCRPSDFSIPSWGGVGMVQVRVGVVHSLEIATFQ